MAKLRVGAILLAAGRSTRMGSQKLLLPWAGNTVIGHIASIVQSSLVREAVVVTGSDAEAVEDAVGTLRCVRNPDVDRGMLSSVRVGLASLPEGIDGVVLFLGDQPSVSCELINGLITFAESCSARIALPVWHGKRGHPLYFSMTYRDEILRDFDDQGLRGLLARYPDEVREWAADEPGVLDDLDTPDDYARARAGQ